MEETMMDRDELLKKLRSSQTNSYEQWTQQAKTLDLAGLDEEVTNYCLARAYVSDDGFYYYLQHILGYSNPKHPRSSSTSHFTVRSVSLPPIQTTSTR